MKKFVTRVLPLLLVLLLPALALAAAVPAVSDNTMAPLLDPAGAAAGNVGATPTDAVADPADDASGDTAIQPVIDGLRITSIWGKPVDEEVDDTVSMRAIWGVNGEAVEGEEGEEGLEPEVDRNSMFSIWGAEEEEEGVVDNATSMSAIWGTKPAEDIQVATETVAE